MQENDRKASFLWIGKHWLYIVNHWIIPVPLSSRPEVWYGAKASYAYWEKSLFKAEFSSSSYHTAPWQPSVALPLFVSCCLYLLVLKATIATKTNTCYAMLCFDAGKVLCSLFYLYIACTNRFLIYSEINLVIIKQFGNTC